MRTSLITSAVVATLITVGFAASAGAAPSGGSDAAATPTTVPFGLDALGLTSEQMDCLMSSAGTADLSDMNAIMDLMAQCGINLMDLVTGGESPVDPAIGVESSVVPPVDGSIDPAAAAAVMVLLGVDSAAAACIEAGLAASTDGNDEAALATLQSCGLSLHDLLTGVLDVNDLAAGEAVEPTEPGVPTTGAGSLSGSPLIQQLIDLIRDQYGIELDPDQASCLIDNVLSIDPSDVEATLAVLEACGISLTDLAG